MSTATRWSDIRLARPEDRAGAMEIVEAIGLFPPEGVEEVGAMLSAYLDGTAEPGHAWHIDHDGGRPVGLAYVAPERMTSGTWNVLLIAIHPDRQGEGRGAALLRHVEQDLAGRSERVLLVETSGLPSFAPQRAFYLRCGYDEEARIREFYQAGEDKVVFRKALTV